MPRRTMKAHISEMDRRKIYYRLHSGKNSKLKYYTASVLRLAVPRCLLRPLLPGMLARLNGRKDREYILDRVNYYCKLSDTTAYDRELWRQRSVAVKDQQLPSQKVYYYDAMRYARWFDPTLRWILVTGDNSDSMDVPAILKSRLAGGDNACSVVMKLNAVRHYIFVNDKKDWRDKKDMAIFRGGIVGRRRLAMRYAFIEKYFGRPMFDIGVLDREFPDWYTERMTIKEHLDYKFLMTLEGNDVASNLNRVMSSNSIAVMPRPVCETWFMEGRLIPDYHYIEIKPDFSDIEERLTYYINHPDEALRIIHNAHEWVRQFRNTRRETLISLLTLDKYFRITNSTTR